MTAPASVQPTPRAAHPLKSLRLPAFWILGVVLVVCTVRLLDLLRSPLARYPVATTVAVLLFALYAVPFWLFISAMDFLEREPPLLLATAFAWGAMVSTTSAMPGNRALLDLTAKLVSPEFAMAWGPAIASPVIEELIKALGFVMIVLVARKQINSVLDGMVYGALIGLGFQVVENIFYALNSVEMANSGDQVGPVIATFFLRGFLAGLWSHTLFSALAGAGIAWFLVRTDRSLWARWGGLAAGLGLAWGIHFIWNSPLLLDGLGQQGVGLLVGLLLKGLPALLLAMGLLFVARHREANFYVDYLARLRDPRVATPEELHTLRHGHLRADARRYGKLRAGKAGRRAVRELQTAQARLAVELSRAPVPAWDDPILAHALREVLNQRRRLLFLAHEEAVASPMRPAVPRVVVLVTTTAIVLCVLIWSAIEAMHGA
ncbi:PrsW family intramembrane metalloprotease [Allorhizocola rhizosphaerae]|uniref:PrsW family intramembrane metalloprotease n=1 Tax=Allorhizocola rhizosphaerae TaxID=1872709 RepID=UPI001FE7492D|nr:PrsW family intramembrane metalloprotease [Allorhizocola rhizosphaerae]